MRAPVLSGVGHASMEAAAQAYRQLGGILSQAGDDVRAALTAAAAFEGEAADREPCPSRTAGANRGGRCGTGPARGHRAGGPGHVPRGRAQRDAAARAARGRSGSAWPRARGDATGAQRPPGPGDPGGRTGTRPTRTTTWTTGSRPSSRRRTRPSISLRRPPEVRCSGAGPRLRPAPGRSPPRPGRPAGLRWVARRRRRRPLSPPRRWCRGQVPVASRHRERSSRMRGRVRGGPAWARRRRPAPRSRSASRASLPPGPGSQHGPRGQPVPAGPAGPAAAPVPVPWMARAARLCRGRAGSGARHPAWATAVRHAPRPSAVVRPSAARRTVPGRPLRHGQGHPVPLRDTCP